jgi:hypothetical protein
LFSIIAMLLSSLPGALPGPLKWRALGTKNRGFRRRALSLRETALRRRKDHGQTTTHGSSRTYFGIEMPVPCYETATLNGTRVLRGDSARIGRSNMIARMIAGIRRQHLEWHLRPGGKRHAAEADADCGAGSVLMRVELQSSPSQPQRGNGND